MNAIILRPYVYWRHSQTDRYSEKAIKRMWGSSRSITEQSGSLRWILDGPQETCKSSLLRFVPRTVTKSDHNVPVMNGV